MEIINPIFGLTNANALASCACTCTTTVPNAPAYSDVRDIQGSTTECLCNCTCQGGNEANRSINYSGAHNYGRDH